MNPIPFRALRRWAAAVLCWPVLAVGQTLVALPEEAPGHIHVGLVEGVGVTMREDALPGWMQVLGQEGFLASPGRESENPLAPCSLLTASLTGATLNVLWFEMNVRGTVSFPKGTHILRDYEADIRRARGGIPKQDRQLAADILARLYILHSWMVNPMSNAIVLASTQQQCLEHLMTGPDGVQQRASALQRGEPVMDHTPATRLWFATRTKETAEVNLAALRSPGALEAAASSAASPVQACSLLGGLRLASALNRAWGEVLAGRTPTAHSERLKPHADALKQPLATLQPGERQAELLAIVVADTVLRTADITAQLTEGMTQGDCLDEIFEPGNLRRRLNQQGRMLPLR